MILFAFYSTKFKHAIACFVERHHPGHDQQFERLQLHPPTHNIPTSHNGAPSSQCTECNARSHIFSTRTVSSDIVTRFLGCRRDIHGLYVCTIVPAIHHANRCPVYLIFSRKRSGARGSALLLVGPPDGGKTAVLSTVWPNYVFRLAFPETTSAGIQSYPPDTHVVTDQLVCNLINASAEDITCC